MHHRAMVLAATARAGEFVPREAERQEQILDIDPVNEKTQAEYEGPRRSLLDPWGLISG